jgi:isopentenyl-diphosphate delta-isomerase
LDDNGIGQRKDEHIDIVINEGVTMSRTTGFENFAFIHQALPEIDLTEISLATTFLGHQLSAPLLISSMTGGTERGQEINRHLAEAARELGLAMAVGSQRIMLEDPQAIPSFSVVREVAPDIALFGNLGAIQFNYGMALDDLKEAADLIHADGMFLHLNPLQESIQPEGQTNFSGLLDKIGEMAQSLAIPLLIKEVGGGIAPNLARKLAERHVQGIDVSGAGGTSWAAIEGMRTTDPARRRLAQVFANWGIGTARSLILCRRVLPTFPLIASGGIRNGLDAAKALALGANLVGLAYPLLKPATTGTKEVIEVLRQFLTEIQVAMFLTGSKTVNDLKTRRVIRPVHE